MPDFNGINPFGVPFRNNPNRKNNQPSASGEPDAPANGERYADRLMSPEQTFAALSQLSQSNLILHDANVGKMASLMRGGLASPEEHAKVTRLISETYRQEFGSEPPSELLAEMVDDYLIGQVVIQTP